MENRHAKKSILIPLVILLMAPPAVSAAQGIEVSYLYKLSNFTGTIPYDWVKVALDKGSNDEAYVVSGSAVRIFNNRGMEVYSYGSYDMGLGTIYDMAIDDDGNLYALSYKEVQEERGGVFKRELSITLCNYRGEPVSALELKGLPSEISDFLPNRMLFHNGFLYFVSTPGMMVVVTDTEGNFKESYDLLALSNLKEEERENAGIVGFNINKDGNMLFTIPVIGQAFVLYKDKTVRAFGTRGSSPGKFGVPAGIASDKFGNYYVADTLRSVVIVFDSEFTFIKEFGYRGNRPHNLIGPRNLQMDDNGRLYVTQLRKRGVSVFQITPANQQKGGDVESVN